MLAGSSARGDLPRPARRSQLHCRVVLHGPRVAAHRQQPRVFALDGGAVARASRGRHRLPREFWLLATACLLVPRDGNPTHQAARDAMTPGRLIVPVRVGEPALARYSRGACARAPTHALKVAPTSPRYRLKRPRARYHGANLPVEWPPHRPLEAHSGVQPRRRAQPRPWNGRAYTAISDQRSRPEPGRRNRTASPRGRDVPLAPERAPPPRLVLPPALPASAPPAGRNPRPSWGRGPPPCVPVPSPPLPQRRPGDES